MCEPLLIVPALIGRSGPHNNESPSPGPGILIHTGRDIEHDQHNAAANFIWEYEHNYKYAPNTCTQDRRIGG